MTEGTCRNNGLAGWELVDDLLQLFQIFHRAWILIAGGQSMTFFDLQQAETHEGNQAEACSEDKTWKILQSSS